MIIPPRIFPYPLSRKSPKVKTGSSASLFFPAVFLIGFLILAGVPASGQDDQVITGTVRHGIQKVTINFMELPRLAPGEDPSRRVASPFMPTPGNFPIPDRVKATTERML